jgi:hypothetical protein
MEEDLITNNKRYKLLKFYYYNIEKDYNDISTISLCYILFAEIPFFLVFGILFYLFSYNYCYISDLSIIMSYIYLTFSGISFLLFFLIFLYNICDQNRLIYKIYEKTNITYKAIYILTHLFLVAIISFKYFSGYIDKDDCDELNMITLSWIIIEYILILIVIVLISMICCCYFSK